MRSRVAFLIAIFVLAVAAAPAVAITKGGVPDAGEHPMVGQLVFYVPDAETTVYPDPGGWFSCSGTLVSGTVVVTAGHCTFAVGLNGVSTTTEEDRFTAEDGNGSGGNDVWFTLNEDDDHWDGWPETFDGDGDLNYPPRRPVTPHGRRSSRAIRSGSGRRPTRIRSTTNGSSTSTMPG